MGAVAQPVPFAMIDGRRWEAVSNPNLLNKDGTKKSTLDHVIEFCKSANGAFRVLQFLERVTKIAILVLKEMGSSMVKFCEDLAGKLGVAWGMMGIARLPDVSKKAWNAVTEWINPPALAPVDANRDKIEKLHDIADATAAWGYAGSLVAGNIALKNMADIPNLVADVTDLQTSTQDWYLAKKHVEAIDTQPRNMGNDAIHNLFASKMQYSLIAMIKAISSVVGGVLGLLVLAMGGPILPAAILVAISMTSTISAIAKHFFEETREYKMPDFFKHQAQVLVAGADVRAAGG
jgi:hypothetical protein